MSALAMEVALKRRMSFYGVTLATLALSLEPPTSSPMTLEGIAASTTIDLQRVKFMPRCFKWDRKVPLLYRHSDPAGEVDDLWDSREGDLLARVTATHILGRRAPCFSISASVHSYVLVNKDGEDFFAAVTSASVVELSLTTNPCNPVCKVTRRSPAFPTPPQFYDEASTKIANMMRLLKEPRNVTV
jgi:hypothetical protein